MHHRYRHAACGVPSRNDKSHANLSEGSRRVVVWGGFAPSFISDEPFADVHVLEVVSSSSLQASKEHQQQQEKKKDQWALRWSEVAMAGPPPSPAGSAALAWLGGSAVALFGMVGWGSHAMSFGTNPANLFLPEEKDSNQVAVFRVAGNNATNDGEEILEQENEGEELQDYTWYYEADPYNRDSSNSSSEEFVGFEEAFSPNSEKASDQYRPAVRCGATANVVCTPSGDVGILVLGGRQYVCRSAGILHVIVTQCGNGKVQ